jgi:hypothetical protein
LALITEQSEIGTDGNNQGELLQHMVAHLLCDQRRTVTGLLSALGRQQQDWSSAYRLYREHVDKDAIFGPILDGVLEFLPEDKPLVLALDDSYMKKTGKHIAAAGWYKDPLGPQFHVNLFYAHRFLQLSAAVPDPTNPKRSRMIPIAVKLIPKLPKPSKDASREDWARYEQLKAQNSPGVHALQLLRQVRKHLDVGKQRNRLIWACGDGDYSNSTVLGELPDRVVYIGRTRADISLRKVPKTPRRRSAGRPRAYGRKLPTPGQLRQDRNTPWQTTEICNSSSTTHVRYKHVHQAKWHAAGEDAVLQIVIIAPLRYQKRKQGPWCYTQPAYLICTDASIPVFDLLQAYFWRWGIEVNFKEEKQLFGVGKAQVRNSPSVVTAPAVCIATYAALLLAGLRVYGFHALPSTLCSPKWYPRKQHAHTTCSDLIRQLRHDLTLSAALNFRPLASRLHLNTTSQKLDIQPAA